MSEYLHPGPHPDADQLNAYREGVLPEHERLECLAHLAECGHCRQIVFLAQEVLAPSVSSAPAPLRRKWFAPIPIFGGAALAASALLVITSLHLHHAPAPQPPKEVAQSDQAHSEQPVPPTKNEEPIPAQPSSAGKTSPPQLKTRQSIGADQHAAATLLSPSPPLAKALTFSNVPSATPATPPSGQATASGAVIGGSVSAFRSMDKLSSANAPVNTKPGAIGQLSSAPPPPPPAPVDTMRMQRFASDHQAEAGTPQGKTGGQVSAALAPMRRENFPSSPGGISLWVEHGRGPADGLTQVTGTVTDASGAVIPGASIMLRQPAGTISNTQTNAAGQFTVASLPAGKYELQVASPGFQAVSRQIELQPRDLARLSSVLPVGAAAETVTVQSSASPLETETADAQIALIPARKAKAFPLPSKLPVLSSASLGDRMLAVDSAGALFFTGDQGKHWTLVTPQWPGKVAQVAVSAKLPASAPQKKQVAGGPPSFQLTTDSGALWLSLDGLHWHLLQQ